METKSTPNHTDLLNEVVDYVSSVSVKTGCPSRKEISCEVSLTNVIETISDLLAMRINIALPREAVSSQDILEMFTVLTVLRVLQCNGKLPQGIRPRNVPVPDIFVPFLASINVATLPDIGVKIYPVWESESHDVTPAEGGKPGVLINTDGKSLKDMLSQIETTAFLLQTQGVRITKGLPKIVDTSDDVMFRIKLDEDGVLWATGPEPGSVALLIRAVVNMTISEEIFGSYRTRYLSLEDLRPSFDMIVAAAFSRK